MVNRNTHGRWDSKKYEWVIIDIVLGNLTKTVLRKKKVRIKRKGL